ncbi:MAG: hypothetical protein ABWZ75_05805 [Novosphingobium sp.]
MSDLPKNALAYSPGTGKYSGTLHPPEHSSYPVAVAIEQIRTTSPIVPEISTKRSIGELNRYGKQIALKQWAQSFSGLRPGQLFRAGLLNPK